jgi:hypothetical protein
MALQVLLIIPPSSIWPIPIITEDMTPEEVEATQQAINEAIDHNDGDIFPESYATVLYVRDGGPETYICVRWHESVIAYRAGAQPAKLYEYIAQTADLHGDTPEEAAYAWLLTLPEFAGAIVVP